MALTRAKINPALLVWAREDAGFTAEAAATRLRVKLEQLQAWEGGKSLPTLGQARRVSELYKRPLALFFMTDKPTGFMVIRDFRRLPGDVAGEYSPELRLELRRAQERRRMALQLAQELEEQPPRFRLRCDLNSDPEDVGMAIREALDVSVDVQARWHDRRVAFGEWRSRLESLGVLVFMIPTLPTTVVRGFSIANPLLPVIGVSRKDAWSARAFTMLHETAHLMLRVSGACDLYEFVRRLPDEERIEVFCNAVAGAALVPADSLHQHPLVTAHARQSMEWRDEEIEELAAYFACSREALLRRLLKFRRTSQAFYQLKREEYDAEYQQSLERKRQQLEKNKMKRNIPQETVSIFGHPFLRLAFGNYHQQRITLNDLSELLGVKVRHVPKIEDRL